MLRPLLNSVMREIMKYFCHQEIFSKYIPAKIQIYQLKLLPLSRVKTICQRLLINKPTKGTF